MAGTSLNIRVSLPNDPDLDVNYQSFFMASLYETQHLHLRNVQVPITHPKDEYVTLRSQVNQSVMHWEDEEFPFNHVQYLREKTLQHQKQYESYLAEQAVQTSLIKSLNDASFQMSSPSLAQNRRIAASYQKQHNYAADSFKRITLAEQKQRTEKTKNAKK